MSLEKDVFFERKAEQGLSLTYQDVRLTTGYGNPEYVDVDPPEVDLRSRFSRNVRLLTPMVSAAMDTVTTSDMAIAMAKLGGIGTIHAGLDIPEQRAEVRRVKLHLNGLIEKPVSVRADEPVESVLNMLHDRHFDFKTLPVTDGAGVFVGMLSQRHFDFCEDRSQLVAEVMTPAEAIQSAPEDTDYRQAFDLMKRHDNKTLPLLDETGRITGLYLLSDVLRLVRENPDNYNLDDNGRLRVAAAVPTDPKAVERVGYMRPYLDVAVVDSAQGDSKYAFQTLKDLKENFPDLDVVVGNVSQAGSARKLAEAGADGIKVGQGPGSICTTRIETGIGQPQVTAVYECAKAAREYDIPVCADGGITEPGDISIAIAAGAASVMMGRALAGTDEAPGEVIMLENGNRVMSYRGMGSPSALKESAASRNRYAAGGGEALPEGVESYVEYKGSLNSVMRHYILALRKSMSYVGAPTIDRHIAHTRFDWVSTNGYRESETHDVMVKAS